MLAYPMHSIHQYIVFYTNKIIGISMFLSGIDHDIPYSLYLAPPLK